ncbi:MAG: hypothetical protein KC800_04300 [Candidatus Eremiobacteraeota bacterium]|nr:hypothetical protein [Candidatus Eremiobacteraeota bacterium]
MSQVNIPIKLQGGFKNVEAAMAHRQVVNKATELRSQANEAANDLKSVDRADIGAVSSDEWTDLADGMGHVIMIGDNEDGSVRGMELSYDPQSGRTREFVAYVPQGKLTQGPEIQDSNLSPTYKWEEKGDTTYFKFDDNRNVLSILDPKSDNPKIIAGGNPNIVNELARGTIQGGIPIFEF